MLKAIYMANLTLPF